jgi:hypothetical protein
MSISKKEGGQYKIGAIKRKGREEFFPIWGYGEQPSEGCRMTAGCL